MKPFSSEKGLAARVVEHLRVEGWTVYQEVHDGSSTCDIVGVRGPLVWAIETKLQFGCAVLEQANGWLSCANLVSVATPPAKTSHVLREYAAWKGIGWLLVTSNRVEEDYRLTPAIRRIRDHEWSLRKHLRPEQQTAVAAGGNEGGYWTDFKDTCRKVATLVAQQPGISLRELVERTKHHYRTNAIARSSIVHWAERGKIAGVELRREGKALRLYPPGAPTEERT